MASVIMGVTLDEYELPLVVANNVDEFCKLTGFKKHTVHGALCKTRQHSYSGKRTGMKIIRVEFEDDNIIDKHDVNELSRKFTQHKYKTTNKKRNIRNHSNK